jgi:hypothetical protein
VAYRLLHKFAAKRWICDPEGKKGEGKDDFTMEVRVETPAIRQVVEAQRRRARRP